MGRDKATSLAPGFRFHPTDEELVSYYLKRKISGKPFRFDAISEIDIYKSEPWDLPGKSKLKSRDLEWYFFSGLDKKYGNGSRTNRATVKGYWKTTGKDRSVCRRGHTVGMKKTLVYHCGRAPRGERTNWVMHEYRLVDEELEKAGVPQDAFVLCRIFQKSGSGPKNGEQYGAPFVEEEWDDDVAVLVPGDEAVDEVAAADEGYVEANDLDQDLNMGIQPKNVLLPLNFDYGGTSTYPEDSRDLVQNDEKPFVGTGEIHLPSELPDGQLFFGLPPPYEMDVKSVSDEYFVEQNDGMNPEDANYLLDEPYLDATDNPPEMDAKSVREEYFVKQSDNMNPVEANDLFDEPYLDATDNPPFDDGWFLETNDLLGPVKADSSGPDMFEEYLASLDAEGDDFQYVAFDSSNMMGIENPINGQTFLTQEHANGQTEQVSMASHHLLKSHNNDGASSSKESRKAEEFESDVKHPLIKQAHRMLDSIPAPPAFALEFPSKDAVLRLNSAAQSSGSVHVTAGMIQIRNITISDLSFSKNGDINFILSLGLPQGVVDSTGLEPSSSYLSGKMASAMSRGWFYLICFWGLILSLSYKVGTYIYAR